MDNLYYTPPTDEQFEEVKQAAIEIWQTYHNSYGYVDEKLNRLRGLGNFGDNFMFIVAMFDHQNQNQNKLAKALSTQARVAIRERLIAGGLPEFLIEF